ncbi:DUF2958 domain-containing protein [Aneurinibacillus tyrosinisolvens]|uniref:DUF2958 domain-containing protein n=1 Tax=Aneurinibacillus tyrosinisolvens TaxID=1443435 RepID=UPI00063EE6A6|nr:DUF2958 domain-containing protein [Aneurinibacillus tyrosinisolvens]
MKNKQLQLPADIAEKLPELYATEEVTYAEKLVLAKYFSPYSHFTWYVIEGRQEHEDYYLFWGIVDGQYREAGYFSLEELESVTAMNGQLPLVERDEHFTPKTVKELGLA